MRETPPGWFAVSGQIERTRNNAGVFNRIRWPAIGELKHAVVEGVHSRVRGLADGKIHINTEIR